jgi:hypothetical protein
MVAKIYTSLYQKNNNFQLALENLHSIVCAGASTPELRTSGLDGVVCVSVYVWRTYLGSNIFHIDNPTTNLLYSDNIRIFHSEKPAIKLVILNGKTNILTFIFCSACCDLYLFFFLSFFQIYCVLNNQCN